MNHQHAASSHALRSAYEGQKLAVIDPQAAIGASLELHQCTVSPEWIDYNQHMSESCYLLAFGDNSDAFLRACGIDEGYRAAGYSVYTAETHLRHLREATLGTPLRLTLQLLDVDHRRLHIFHQMYHAQSHTLLATAEQLLLHVDMRAGHAAAFPPELQTRLHAIHTAHARILRPADAGRGMTFNHRRPA